MSDMQEIDSLESEGALLGSASITSVIANGHLRVEQDLPLQGNVGDLVHVSSVGITYICTESDTEILVANWKEI